LSLLLLAAVRAAAAEPVVFVVDARPGNASAVAPGSLGILGAVVGNMAQRSVDRKAAEIAAELYPLLSFDVLDALVESVPVPASIGAVPADVIALRVANEATLARTLGERDVQEALLVHYLAVPDRRFWSQLRVQRVTLAAGKPSYAPLATAYYISTLAEEQKHGRSGWAASAVPHLESEVRASFAELAAMWARIVADADGAGNPQPAWQVLPPVPKEQGDWVFHCTAMANCSGERLVKLTPERAWISAPKSVGVVLASLDHTAAAQAPNFIWIPISSGVP